MNIPFQDFIYLFLEKGEGKEKERESNSNVWLPLVCPVLGTQPATQACAPDWESNHRPLGSQSGAQSTEPRQPGLWTFTFKSRGTSFPEAPSKVHLIFHWSTWLLSKPISMLKEMSSIYWLRSPGLCQ